MEEGFERLSCSHVLTPYVCSVQAFVHSCQSDLSCHVTQPWPRDLPSLPLLARSLARSQNSLTEKQESSDSFLWFMSSYHNHRSPPINPSTTTANLPTHQPLAFWHLCVSLCCGFHLNSTFWGLHRAFFCFRVEQKWWSVALVSL